MSNIPRVAAQWMVFHLPSRHGHDYYVDLLEKRGLGMLNVKELKRLGEILYSMIPVVEEVSIRERRLPASAKKQQRVDFLRRGLFRDDSCKILNDRLLQQMQSETRKNSSTPVSSTSTTLVAASSSSAARDNNSSGSTTTSASDSRKRPNNQISQQNQPRQPQQQPQQHPPHQQQQQQQQNRITANDMNAFFNAYQMSQFNPPGSFAPQHRPPHNQGHYFWPIEPMTPAQNLFGGPDGRQMGNETGASAEAGSSFAAVAPAGDPHTTPQNPTEVILLQQLLQMGFQKQEILDGIRQCQSTNNATPTADDVMLHLVSQREEAEEARKEDEVRLLSENQKEEESKRCEKKQQESLSKATTGEDLKAIFSESWVLTAMLAKSGSDSKDKNRSVSTILDSDSRDDFLEFLKLEEKSRKWYGWKLPSEYFRKVGKRLNSAGDKKQASSWVTFLKSEREKLLCGLYELKEQLKGQPKIFLDERPEETGGAAEIVIIDDD